MSLTKEDREEISNFVLDMLAGTVFERSMANDKRAVADKFSLKEKPKTAFEKWLGENKDIRDCLPGYEHPVRSVSLLAFNAGRASVDAETLESALKRCGCGDGASSWRPTGKTLAAELKRMES